MANYANLKAQIDANVYQNDSQAITGSVMNTQLKSTPWAPAISSRASPRPPPTPASRTRRCFISPPFRGLTQISVVTMYGRVRPLC